MTEALIFLHSLHYLHAGLTSHAVMLVSNSVTKLGLLDKMVSQEETKPEKLDVHCDVFSLCCVLLELCSGQASLQNTDYWNI